MEKLTARQKQVLEFITRHIDGNGYPPTLRDIAGHLHVNGTLGVMKHLDALEKKGYIKRDSNTSRGITLAGHSAGAVALPVAGTVRAGLPQPAVEDVEGYFSIDSSQMKSGGAFFLRVKGDSMIEDGIRDGDYIIVEGRDSADNGETVVALIGNEATVKKFYRESSGQIRLQPANSAMQPIMVGEGDLAIRGVVVGLMRHYR